MPERDGADGIVDSDWIVGSDGFTFHEHEDLYTALNEELEGRQAIDKLLEALRGDKSIEQRISEFATSFRRRVY